MPLVGVGEALLRTSAAALLLLACARQSAPREAGPARDELEASPAGSEEAAPAPGSPRADAAPSSTGEFRSLAEAEQAFMRARQELDSLLAASVDDEMFAEEAPAAGQAEASRRSRLRAGTSAPGPAADESAPSGARAVAAKERGGGTATPCPRVCEALTSMRRAARAICRLAGEQSVQCLQAERSLGRSQQRASACACGHE